MTGVQTCALPISISMVRAMKLREKEKVVFEYDKRRKRIIIKDWK